MADPFGDKSKETDADKRPAHTIEGTAEEVPSEAEAPNDDQAAAASDETSETEPVGDAGDAVSDDPELKELDELSDHEREAVPPSARSGGGFLSHVLAGVIGGVIGVVALFLAVTYYPSLATRSAPELEARVAELENRKPPAAEVTRNDLSGLEDRVAKLESTIDSMADQAQKGGSVADAAAVSQQIGDAEKRLENKIDERLAELPEAGSDGAESGAAKKQVADLRQQIDGLKSEVATLSQTQAKVNAADAVGEADLDAVKTRVAKLEDQLPDISSAVKQSASEARSAAMTASLADLRTAVQSGGPYKSELDEFKGIAPASTELTPLPAHAADGIATMPELITAFEPARDKALATEVEPAEEGFFDTLLSSAGSVVKVRRLDGAGKGNSTEAILTRARAALDEGDLAKAISEVESLKSEPKQAMEDWLAAAQARADAQSTLKRLSAAEAGNASDTETGADSAGSSGL
ncbi:Mitochondrial inner membrane protein [Methyloligella halotolerans]|uniref:Mitochondrial inner membrane protein n=1 Tax=Methyloligella halotolerans TaxID=1177755 RepID=A0A1E2S0B0_9HYPH|nr:mitofilin family membrane protein [Methyloligella halotolerans]ODA67933.1 Mitochondrial inner membrane protein [Methyloligella halotolerans]